MSGFWTLKIGKSKQDNGKSAKRNGNGTNSSEIVRALMDRVLTDAEQLVDSIKAKALKEAEAEITRLIEQAGLGEPDTDATISEKRETDEIASVIAPEEEYADIAQVVDTGETDSVTPEPEARITPESVTGKTGEDEIKPAFAEDDSPEKTEPKSEENIESPEDPAPAEMNVDKHMMYSEEVELAVLKPVDPAALSRLYNSLQMTPEIKIMYTRGSWDKGTVITVDLEKPLPLLEIISGVPEIEATIMEHQKNEVPLKPSGVLLGNGKKNIKRIDLLIKSK